MLLLKSKEPFLYINFIRNCDGNVYILSNADELLSMYNMSYVINLFEITVREQTEFKLSQ